MSAFEIGSNIINLPVDEVLRYLNNSGFCDPEGPSQPGEVRTTIFKDTSSGKPNSARCVLSLSGSRERVATAARRINAELNPRLDELRHPRVAWMSSSRNTLVEE